MGAVVFTKICRPESGWPIVHTNGDAAARTVLLAAPGNSYSHYITGMVFAVPDSAHWTPGNGVRVLRRACAKFTAANNTITVTDAASMQMGTGDLSVGLWFKWQTGTVGAVAGLLSKYAGGGSGWKWSINSAGTARFTIGDGVATSVYLNTPRTVCDGYWHHLMATVDRDVATGFNLYVDGQLVATGDPTSITGNINGTATDLTMTGIASVTLYASALEVYKGTALSAAAVRAVFNPITIGAGGIGRKTVGTETGLSLALPLDEGTDTTTYDILATSNGTLVNTTWADEGICLPDANTRGISESLKNLPLLDALDHPNVTFEPAIKVGRNNPLAILETAGAWSVIITGFTESGSI
jgi:hypothetical protein